MALKNKYQRQKEQYSTDGGITWLDVTPPNYRKGNVIEMGSDDCNTIEWIEVDGSWFCIGTDTVTRWVVVTNEYMCSNGNKYQKEKEQISYDNGVTWSDTGNARTGSLIEADSEDCNYANQYLTFVALEDGTFSFTQNDIQYSLDNGSTWATLSANTQSPTVTTGNKILWKAENPTISTSSPMGIGIFSSTGRYDVECNVMSLFYGDNFINQTDLTGKANAFTSLFAFNTNLVNANNLVLPATTLSNYCYGGMFQGCTSLVTAPVLPATTLTMNCYNTMFKGCTSLVTAPELPSTTLANNCYMNMFQGCTSLTTAPVLPATTLSLYCYSQMFDSCTSLNYIKAMFTEIPSNNNPISNWVRNVAATGTFVKNNAATWNVWGNSGIPNGWTVQTASE